MADINAQLESLLFRWRSDPVAFVQEAFSGDPRNPPPVPEKWQEAVLMALTTEDRIAIRSGHGVGKALAVTEQVFTPDGPALIGQLRPGDFVATPAGTFSEVLGVYPQGVRRLYEVSFDDGTSVLADADHLWTTTDRRGQLREFTTVEVARTLIDGARRRVNGKYLFRHRLPAVQPLELPDIDMTQWGIKDAARALDAGFLALACGAGVEQRRLALAGALEALFANDAVLTPTGAVRSGAVLYQGGMRIVRYRADLFAPLAFLVRSLGGWAKVTNETLLVHPSPFVDFTPTTFTPATRKGLTTRESYITQVSRKGEGEAVCIRVDRPDGLFLCGQWKPTHNTTLLSWVVLWFALTRYPFKIPCTAPAGATLASGLWPEIGKWHRRLHPVLKRMLTVTSDRVELAGDKTSFAEARTSRADQPEALQGFHEDNLLFCLDEASGIPDIIFEVGQGSLSTRGAKMLMTGNPTRRSGYFFEAFHPKAGERRWHTIHVPCSASSRVDPAWIEEMKAKYGEESPVYAVRVLGEFPRSDDWSLIPMHLVEEAVRRGREIERHPGPVVWGLDVARQGGDANALAKRMGRHLLEPVTSWTSPDLMVTVGRVLREWESTLDVYKPREIMVDIIGLGAGVHDRLGELGLPVKPVNVSTSSSDPKRFARLRDELWMKLRDWLQMVDTTLVDDPALAVEMCEVRQIMRSTGRIDVESKEDMKKRGVASPNLADALCLTFAASERWTRTSNVVRSDMRRAPAQADRSYDPRRW